MLLQIDLLSLIVLVTSYGYIPVSTDTNCNLHKIAVVVDSTKEVPEMEFNAGFGMKQYIHTLMMQLKLSGIRSYYMSGRVYHSNLFCQETNTLETAERFLPTKTDGYIRKAVELLKYYKSEDSFNLSCAESHLFAQHNNFTEYPNEKVVGLIIAVYKSVKDKFKGAKGEGQYGVFVYHGMVLQGKSLSTSEKLGEVVSLMKPSVCRTSPSVHRSSTLTSSYATSLSTKQQYSTRKSTFLKTKAASSSYKKPSSTSRILMTTSYIVSSIRPTVMIGFTSKAINPTSVIPTPGHTVAPKTTRGTKEKLNADIEEFLKKDVSPEDTEAVQEFMKEGLVLLRRIEKNHILTENPTKLIEFLRRSLLSIGNGRTDMPDILYNETGSGMKVTTHNIKSLDQLEYHNGCNQITLPKAVFQSKRDASNNRAIAAIIEYPTLPVMITDTEKYVSDTSFLAAANLSNGDEVISRSEILYTLSITKEKHSTSKYKCVFWEKSSLTNGSWGDKGCDFVSISGDQVKCKCQYRKTLSFSVMRLRSPTSRFSLDITTYIGCAVAGGVCIIILLIFIMFRDALRYDQNVIHLNLAIAVALSNGLFIAADFAYKIKYVCMGVSIGIMYFYLATLFWILVESFHLYMLVVRRSKDTNMTMFYLIIGWVAPSIIVALTAALEKQYFLREEFCWLTYNHWVIWTLVGPSAFIILVSVILLAVSLCTSFELERSLAGVVKFQRVAKHLFVFIPFIGLSWSISLLAVNEEVIIYQYVLAGVNGVIALLGLSSLFFLNSRDTKGMATKKKSMQSTRSNSSMPMGNDNKGNDASTLSLSVIADPAFHSKTNL